MSEKTLPRLGRGLESLIPKSFLASGKTVINIPVNELIPNEYQPRLQFDKKALDELAHSIKQHGLAQPVVVRRKEKGYELIAGERRFRASQLAGMTTIPAIIRDVSDKESLQIALIENLDREDLNSVEEAKGYQRLIDEFGMTHQDLANQFGKNRSTITNSLRLLQLPDSVQASIMDGDISSGHARALLSLTDKGELIKAVKRIKAEGLSVRHIEAEMTSKMPEKKRKKSNSPFPEYENALMALGFHVKYKGKKAKGKVEIAYNSEEEASGIMRLLQAVDS